MSTEECFPLAPTVDSIARQLETIRVMTSSGKNGHLAHAWTDGLYLNVLREIAAGSVNCRELAAAVLAAEQIPFERSYD